MQNGGFKIHFTWKLAQVCFFIRSVVEIFSPLFSYIFASWKRAEKQVGVHYIMIQNSFLRFFFQLVSYITSFPFKALIYGNFDLIFQF